MVVKDKSHGYLLNGGVIGESDCMIVKDKSYGYL